MRWPASEPGCWGGSPRSPTLRFGRWRLMARAGGGPGWWGGLPESPDIPFGAWGGNRAGRGLKGVSSGFWIFSDPKGITLKKSLHASEQDRPDVARRRAQWKKYQG